MLIPSRMKKALALAVTGSSVLMTSFGAFSKELRTEIPIRSSAESVWRALTDFEQFPHWNPMIRKVGGEATVEPHCELRWLGRLGIRGLFDGEHIFTIEPAEENSVLFVHRERFSGFLIPFMMPIIQKDTLRGFKDMNVALKARLENAI